MMKSRVPDLCPTGLPETAVQVASVLLKTACKKASEWSYLK